MNIILLSGGSGKRLWPLSNEVRSKQFIRIFRNGDGSGGSEPESMLQRVFRQIRTVDPDAKVTIAAPAQQVSSIRNQLGDKVSLSVEPCRRDTFPAIALSAAFLRDIRGVPEEEVIIVCPVDSYVETEYFSLFGEMKRLAENGSANLVLMGITPTYPSEKYGYIIPVSKDRISEVREFREKPTALLAKEYIAEGGVWNGGVFAFRISYVMERVRELMGYSSYADLLAAYESLTKISFDYAVSEREKKIAVIRYYGKWKDLGTWNTLTEAMEEETVGDIHLGEGCRNVYAVNELGIPILAMGLSNVVISASPDGILVSDKGASSYIKPYVDKIDRQIMYAEKSWGSFRVLDLGKNNMTIKVTLNPGHRMNYHSHDRRDEVWTVVSGRGKTIVDGMEQQVSPGDVLTIAAGVRHTVISETELILIEVQLGEDISVLDKHVYETEQ